MRTKILLLLLQLLQLIYWELFFSSRHAFKHLRCIDSVTMYTYPKSFFIVPFYRWWIINGQNQWVVVSGNMICVPEAHVFRDKVLSDNFRFRGYAQRHSTLRAVTVLGSRVWWLQNCSLPIWAIYLAIYLTLTLKTQG